ncbi:MAG: aldehyde dehydrogenase family protein, partial [Bacteroidia bacterium]|nr:aldehyde dehydrogenase family protein [Bacteroidia bacterium]
MFSLPDKILNYINGELVEPVKKNYISNINPSIGAEYSLIPDSDAEDVQLAVNAASEAFPAWSTLSHQKRFEYLMKIAELIDKKHDFLAYAESFDNGKPLKLAKKVDIPRASANFRFYATAILHYYSQAHINENDSINYTYKQPIGVAGCISPWNLPLYLFTWKIAPVSY